MKKSLYILGLAALTLVSSGCEKEFLDEEPNRYISPDQITEEALKDPSLLNAYLAGIYSTMYTTGTGGTTNHDDYGQKGYDVFSDMLSSDMVLAGVTYGWYSGVARYQVTQDFTQNQAYIPWRYYYRIIFAANGLIELLEGTTDRDLTRQESAALGQAKALRAYAYFYLSHFYGPGYGTGGEKIVPIYTSTVASSQPKSTTAEVYNLIISDLTDAVTRLEGYSRVGKHEINKSVAQGLLSYALAARGTTEDLNQVVALTNDVITASGFKILEKDEVVAQFDSEGNITNADKAGFNNVASQSWMWGMDLVLDYGLNLISWWGQVDMFTYSYAFVGDAKTIDNKLFGAIRTDDVRKNQFAATLEPTNKFFTPARTLGGQRYITTDYVYMRIEEMYLLNAEAKAKLSDDASARIMLKQLLSKRVEDNSYVDNLSGQDLKDEIYLQTRIELWGEGKSYLAMKRNKATITRGTNHLFFPGESFQWDDPKLTFLIPQAEVINNPVLND